MTSPAELGSVFVAVVPTLSGAMAVLATGGADGADTYARAFAEKIKESPELRDGFKVAGDKASEQFSGTFTDAAKTGISKVDTTPLADALKTAGDKASKEFSTEFADQSGKAMAAVGTDLASKFGGGFSSEIDAVVGRVLPELTDLSGGVDSLSNSFSGLAGSLMDAVGKSGDLGTALVNLVPDIDAATSSTEGFGQTVLDAWKNSGGLKDVLPDLGDNFTKIAASITEALGPLAGYVVAAEAAIAATNKLTHNQTNVDPEKNPNGWWGTMFGLAGGPLKRFFDPDKPPPENFYKDWYPEQEPEPLPGPGREPPLHIPVGGAGSPGPGEESPFAHMPDFKPLPQPKPEREPSSGGSGGGRGGAPRVNTSIGSVSNRRDLAAAGSRVANLYAFAESLVGTPYSQALRNDCSGMVSKLANVALGLPPAASFTTVNEGQWLFSHGFQPGIGGPNDLTIGWNPQPGNAGHTAATLPGGVHAEAGGSHGSFLLGPGAVGGEDKQFSMHAYLPMGRGGGGRMPTGQMPSGTANDPVYTAQSDAGGSDSSSQGEQLGHGLVKGLLQELGIPDVFGKSPLEWGSVKLGMGALNWGMGLMKQLGAGGAGMAAGDMAGGGSMAGGMGGLGDALSGLFPADVLSSAPEMPHAGTGAPPGPVPPAAAPPAVSVPPAAHPGVPTPRPEPALTPPGLTPPALTPPGPDPLAGITDPALRAIAQQWIATHGSLPTLPAYTPPPGTPPLLPAPARGGLTGQMPIPAPRKAPRADDISAAMQTRRKDPAPATQSASAGPGINYYINNTGLITPQASKTLTAHQTKTSTFRPVMHV